MTDRLLRQLPAFARHLREEERSAATVEKYLRDVKRFTDFAGHTELDKATVTAYKAMLGSTYRIASANSMIAALNTFLRFCNMGNLCVKQFRVQRQLYRSEEKELTREEYLRLVETAATQKKERVGLILQTICGTGIRVSELEHITVEAVKKGEATIHCKGKLRRIFLIPALRKKLLSFTSKNRIVGGILFRTKKGRPISRHCVWREMKSLCSQAKVLPDKVFPHNLRHLFARTFYRLEKDIAKLADILGHASINTTRIYIATTGAEHKRRMEHLHLII